MFDFVKSLGEAAREKAQQAFHHIDQIAQQQLHQQNLPGTNLGAQLHQIRPNLFIMDFPHEDVIEDLSEALRGFHSNAFLMLNMSERTYNTRMFEGDVIDVNFRGLPSPPLDLLLKLQMSVHAWLSSDPINILVVHCYRGHSRSATFMSAYMAWAGLAEHPLQALEEVCEKVGLDPRTQILPSQKRCLSYVDLLQKGFSAKAPPVSIRRLILNEIPVFDPPTAMLRRTRGGKGVGEEGGEGEKDAQAEEGEEEDEDEEEEVEVPQPVFRPFVEVWVSGEMVYSSLDGLSVSTANGEASSGSKEGGVVQQQNGEQEKAKKDGGGEAADIASDSVATEQKTRKVSAFFINDESCAFEMNVPVLGDALIRVRHLSGSGQKVSALRAAFHTAFDAQDGFLHFERDELDGACVDPRFPETFFMDVLLESERTKAMPKVEGSGVKQQGQEEETGQSKGKGDEDPQEALYKRAREMSAHLQQEAREKAEREIEEARQRERQLEAERRLKALREEAEKKRQREAEAEAEAASSSSTRTTTAGGEVPDAGGRGEEEKERNGGPSASGWTIGSLPSLAGMPDALEGIRPASLSEGIKGVAASAAEIYATVSGGEGGQKEGSTGDPKPPGSTEEMSSSSGEGVPPVSVSEGARTAFPSPPPTQAPPPTATATHAPLSLLASLSFPSGSSRSKEKEKEKTADANQSAPSGAPRSAPPAPPVSGGKDFWDDEEGDDVDEDESPPPSLVLLSGPQHQSQSLTGEQEKGKGGPPARGGSGGPMLFDMTAGEGDEDDEAVAWDDDDEDSPENGGGGDGEDDGPPMLSQG
uniref:Phosphatidylinositol-3,4,5-trisphosphate 3-phosphatase n=1 Tax=Chromera velia CCMP2878 TaxID=1169474 RepID=A0A0G4FH05_9ALVE|eukprot:Cvel_16987.t1-p1 / transcript=Cvel_16987.t1 / gene=Cvel_16987 / organism=Chromera_velia_CCMP2878 / gene_product=Tensin-3, putative / transcript_product=Tensin-3, putative / location=Cvel_scaffold1334:20257-26594(+) / protein_length=812 / sequence_SO=supercontig / SO=protein_coding / is_pseudo=false